MLPSTNKGVKHTCKVFCSTWNNIITIVIVWITFKNGLYIFIHALTKMYNCLAPAVTYHLLYDSCPVTIV